MNSIHQEIRVGFRYSVHFTHEVFAPSNPLLQEVIAHESDHRPAKVLFVIDDGLCGHHNLPAAIETYCTRYKDIIRPAAPLLIVPGGEDVKNHPRHIEDIHQAIHDAGLCRHSYVVAVGGGAVLDAAGYAVATAHRGLRIIRVPSTVLAQDDSGVGVKNSVNAFGKKNYLGTFAPPFAVINDFSFLSSLSDRDWRSGVAEAVKVALIKDAAFFDFIEQRAALLSRRNLPAMEQVIERCAALHLSHIATSGDPFELGSSRPLDFGHWAAHKLEQLTEYRLRHGEAVAIGIALDSVYSCLTGFLADTDCQRITRLLLNLGFSVHTPELSKHLEFEAHPNSIFRGLAEFREHLGGRLTIMLLRSIGQAFEVHEIDKRLMTRSIEVLKSIERVRTLERFSQHDSGGEESCHEFAAQ
jgi:3-dehydroquinate synthase